MKTSWIIGIVSLWFVLWILSSIAAQANLITSTQVGQVQTLAQPTGTDVSTFGGSTTIGQAYSLITNVWAYIFGFLQMLFLWFPTLWVGTWLWFYYVVCLPISIALIISIVFIFRGVHSA